MRISLTLCFFLCRCLCSLILLLCFRWYGIISIGDRINHQSGARSPWNFAVIGLRKREGKREREGRNKGEISMWAFFLYKFQWRNFPVLWLPSLDLWMQKSDVSFLTRNFTRKLNIHPLNFKSLMKLGRFSVFFLMGLVATQILINLTRCRGVTADDSALSTLNHLHRASVGGV